MAPGMAVVHIHTKKTPIYINKSKRNKEKGGKSQVAMCLHLLLLSSPASPALVLLVALIAQHYQCAADSRLPGPALAEKLLPVFSSWSHALPPCEMRTKEEAGPWTGKPV